VTTGRIVLITFAAILLALGVTAAAQVASAIADGNARQAALDPFYTPPSPLPGDPGTLIRTEPLDFADPAQVTEVDGGTAYRMLYISARPDGTPAASGAMVFVPDSPAPAEGRPVLAWAHGTVGMGDSCAPSRTPRGIADMDVWLEQALALGWIVVATDYVGLGTPGDELYLVGQAEANDVVHSVQAVRAWDIAQAGDRYAVYGHSQGGHTALWTGHLAADIDPSLELVGVAAAAPAALLPEIVGVQWDTAAGWAIGPEALVGWRYIDPSLPIAGVLTQAGLDSADRLAQECIEPAALEGYLRTDLGQDFFSINPADAPGWEQIIADQTPPPLPAAMPVFVAQGTADEVVLAWPQAMLQEQWCEAGSAISVDWLGGVNHMKAAIVAGPEAITWIADRFADRPAPRTCDVPPPVAPMPPTQAPPAD
jgi:pimeloyl-ACP methyl ester carboxylesterase